jgi:cob(I)alamin adenosyltransferase
MNKIYTKTGDTGETSLLGGKRVPKYHPRVEAYGNVDELNSFIGLLRCYVEDKELNEVLVNVQQHLYYIGSLVACDSCKEQEKLKQLSNDDILFLEQQIDKLTQQLPELKDFIMPGGNPAVSYAHVCRCVCRRAERAVIQLADSTYIDKLIIIYLNRLSDYLFTLARKLTYDSGLQEIKYK